ncbi:MAG: hypothetical protein OEZ24_03455 [Candidatus Bathyarchaeota archaeon]|nr:hypothetical protein [Candidatus Bathyarchaeota archaeon]
MGEKISLKEIERRAYLSYHQDGLVDVSIGLAILVFGAYILYDPGMVVIGAGSLFVFFLLYAGAKKAITIPRLGYVKFASERKNKIRIILLALALANVASLFASAYRPLAVFLVENYMIVVGVIGAAIFSLVAYLSDIKRFYAYAAMTLVLFPSGYVFHTLFQHNFILMGVLMLFSGVGLLYRFLRKYPKQAGEILDDEPRKR